jgi:DNA-binding response OmpR family regulator
MQRMSNRTASAQPRILVVDDDRAMRDFFATSLRLAGFDVQTAADGIAALNEIDRRRPDVVVLDLDLPIMNGFTVHEALRMQDATCDLPIVVVSGTGWRSPSPVAARLDKPVPAEQLIATIVDVLSRAANGVRSITRVAERNEPIVSRSPLADLAD